MYRLYYLCYGLRRQVLNTCQLLISKDSQSFVHEASGGVRMFSFLTLFVNNSGYFRPTTTGKPDQPSTLTLLSYLARYCCLSILFTVKSAFQTLFNPNYNPFLIPKQYFFNRKTIHNQSNYKPFNNPLHNGSMA